MYSYRLRSTGLMGRNPYNKLCQNKFQYANFVILLLNIQDKKQLKPNAKSCPISNAEDPDQRLDF